MTPRSHDSPSRTGPRRAVVVAVVLLATACERETLLGSNWSPLQSGPDASTAEDAGPCGGWGFPYVDTLCDLDRQGLWTGNCREVGDGLCHRTCASGADCPDPGEPYCRRLGLYKHTNVICTEVVSICSAIREDDCP